MLCLIYCDQVKRGKGLKKTEMAAIDNLLHTKRIKLRHVFVLGGVYSLQNIKRSVSSQLKEKKLDASLQQTFALVPKIRICHFSFLFSVSGL